MPPSSLIEFIDTALSCTSPFALSYADSNQKWLIRKHLISLIQDYPSFTLSADTFNHNDGTTVNLVQATGDLRVANHSPPIPLIIWLHENYPCMPPMVFVLPNSMSPIHQDHPFVDSSGATTSPYLQTWEFPRCNLTELVHNLVKNFTLDHPLACSPVASFTRPSKREALDRLSVKLHHDTIALLAQTEDEMENLPIVQEEMMKRDDIITSMIIGVEHEIMNLKDRVENLTNQADVLVNWLRVHDPKSVVTKAEDEMDDGDAFEAGDGESRLLIEYLAADRALEDLIYALDKAVEQGVASFDVYIRQVRVLAREQFSYKAMLVKLRGPNILHCL